AADMQEAGRGRGETGDDSRCVGACAHAHFLHYRRMATELGTAPSMASGLLQTAPGMWWRGHLRASLAIAETWLDAEREQLPLWLPVGFGLGIAAWFALPTRADWSAFLLASTGIALIAAIGWQAYRIGRGVAFFAGFA